MQTNNIEFEAVKSLINRQKTMANKIPSYCTRYCTPLMSSKMRIKPLQKARRLLNKCAINVIHFEQRDLLTNFTNEIWFIRRTSVVKVEYGSLYVRSYAISKYMITKLPLADRCGRISSLEKRSQQRHKNMNENVIKRTEAKVPNGRTIIKDHRNDNFYLISARRKKIEPSFTRETIPQLIFYTFFSLLFQMPWPLHKSALENKSEK